MSSGIRGILTKFPSISASQWPLFILLLKCYRASFTLAISLSILSGSISPVSSILLGKFMNPLAQVIQGQLDGNEFLVQSLKIVRFLFILGSIDGVVSAAFIAYWIAYGELQARASRLSLFDNFIRRDLQWFESLENGMNSSLLHIQTQVREFQLGISQPLGFIFHTVISAFVSVGVAFAYCWRLTLLILGGFPLVAACSIYAERNVQRYIRKYHKHMVEATKIAYSAIINIVIVKCFNMEYQESRSYEISLKQASIAYSKEAQAHACSTAIATFSKTCLIAIALVYATFLVNHGLASPGSIITAMLSCTTALSSLDGILNHLIVLQRSRSAAGAVQKMLDIDDHNSQNLKAAKKITPKVLLGDVEFKDVTFFYPLRPERLILNRCSLIFSANKTTFVLGKSGSGKSTLGKILLKLYSVQCGQVFIDGMDLESLDTNWLRNNITVVQQKSVLFDGTIFDNIALGTTKPSIVTLDQVMDCIDMADLSNIIAELPLGLYTNVEAGATSLSGGQRQRVALARAKMRSTPILILDECTSALDRAGRVQVMDNILNWRANKTTIIITHDPSFIRSSDVVFVLSNGMVVDSSLADKLRCLEHEAETNERGSRQSNDIFNDVKLRDRNAVRPKKPLQSSGGLLLHSKSFNGRESVNAILEDSEVVPIKDRTSVQFVSNACTTQLQSETFAKGRGIDVRRSIFMEPVTQSGLFMNQKTTPRSSIRIDSSQPSIGGETPSPTIKTTLKHDTGVTKAVFQTTKSQPANPQTLSIAKILSSVWPNINRHGQMKLVFVAGSALITGVVPSVLSYCLSQLFHNLLAAGRWQSVSKKWSLSVIAVGTLDAAAKYASHYLLECVGHAWVNKLRNIAFQAILLQPKSWFDVPQNSATTLCTTLDRHAEETRNLLARFTIILYIAIAMSVIALEWGLILCWKLTLIMVVATPIGVAITKWFEHVSIKWEERCNTAADVTNKIFAETLSEIETVRGLTLESYFHKKYKVASDEALSLGIQRALNCGIVYGLSSSFATFATSAVMAYVAYLVKSQEFSIVEIMTAFMILKRVFSSMEGLLSFIPQLAASVASGSQVLRLTSLPHHDFGEVGIIKLDSSDLSNPMAVRFDKVNFSYPSQPDSKALSTLSMIVCSNQVTAIVGRSGSGKSTITSLIFKLYPFENSATVNGRIMLYGHRIETLDTQILRSMIGYVPQQPVILPATVRDNIFCGDISMHLATEGNMIAAARAAGIHDFILSLPQGYDTMIGEGALGLSGGEAQRLNIARALARKPVCLIFDEPTSALDADNASLIRDTIRQLVRNQKKPIGRTWNQLPLTLIVITHSIEMMELADRVIVLENGQAVEEGRYHELVNEGPKFCELLSLRDED